MKYDPEKHHRRSIRLSEYDYSKSGYYYITICTKNRENLFGEINDGEMVLNEYGEIIKYTWNDLKNHNIIELDLFTIMPNHFHGIIHLVGNVGVVGGVGAGSKPALNRSDINCSNINNPIMNRSVLNIINNRADSDSAPTSSLSEIVRQFKTFSTQRINKIQNVSGVSIWQRNYYEHIIRNENDLNTTRQYIKDNPYKWADDENNLININRK